MARQVFFSFHYNNDVCRAAQVRNMGVVEEDKIVNDNEWEEVRKKDEKSIEKWIDEQMQMRSSIVVLIGTKTASRKWVKMEIKKAWDANKGVVGIRIHNLQTPQWEQSPKGLNPFDQFNLDDVTELNLIVTCDVLEKLGRDIKVGNYVPKIVPPLMVEVPNTMDDNDK
jgi:Sec7-like guanine-nucleotide exchange factor